MLRYFIIIDFQGIKYEHVFMYHDIQLVLDEKANYVWK